MTRKVGFIFLFINQLPLKPFSDENKQRYETKILLHSIGLINLIFKNSEGFIDVLFEKNTFTLKKWIVFTNKVNKTEVLLENIKLNVNIQNKIFQIDQSDPRPPIWRDY